MSVALELFCCYARADQEMLERLQKHLMPLQRQGQIIMWNDADIHAGTEWEKELHRHLENADIILLLISPDFMNSDYCYSTELKRAMQRHEQNNARVIPILLRPTYWKGAPFEKLKMLPANEKPVTNWPSEDDAFHDITEQVNRAVLELQNRREFTEADHHATAGHYREMLASSPGTSTAFGEQPGERLRQKERSMYDQPATSNQGDIHIHAPVTGGVVNIGHDGTISARNVSQNTPLSLDRTSLKASLQELFAALGNAGLPVSVQMETQTATGLAAQQSGMPTLHAEALAYHLQHVGQSLQRASITVEEGSRLANAVIKLAHLFGPVVGEARVVADWFGIHLP